MGDNRFFVFQMVSEDVTDQLLNAKSREDAREILSTIISDYISSLLDTESEIDFKYKRDIILDLLYSALAFAIEKNFNAEKTSCMIEMTYRVFQGSMSKTLPMEKAFELYKSYIMRHALFRPPHSIILYSLEDIKAILDFYKWTFLRQYTMYLKAFTPEISYEVATFTMFKTNLPPTVGLDGGQNANKDELSYLDAFNKDKEIKLTKEELEEIMRGGSIHDIPEWKRQEIIRKHQEAEKQAKIDRFMQKELAKLQQQFEDQVKGQDEDFEKKLSEIKPKK